MWLSITSQFYAQKTYTKLPIAKEHQPTYVFDQKIIESENLLMSYGKSTDEFEKTSTSVSVLKVHQKKGVDDYYNLSEYGIIFIEQKQTTFRISVKTQSELNTFFCLDKALDVYVDSYLVKNKNYKISLAGISDIELIYPNNINRLSNTVLNVWTLPLEKRYKSD